MYSYDRRLALQLEPLPSWTFTKPLTKAFRELDRVDVYKAYGTFEDLFGNLERLEALEPREVREGEQLSRTFAELRRETLNAMVDASNLFEVIKRRAT